MSKLTANIFRKLLRERAPDESNRAWVYVAHDQLNDGLGPLRTMKPGEAGIVLIESEPYLRRRPYHRQKIALLLANQRHFALEQTQRGVAVRYVITDRTVKEALLETATELGPLKATKLAEREMRVHLQPLIDTGLLILGPHDGWLTSKEQFLAKKSWRMDSFYARVRRETGILMHGDKPAGGKYSFDQENRLSWPGEPPAPEPPDFEVDEVTYEVCRTVDTDFNEHPGKLSPEKLPSRADDACALWEWAKRECLPLFGPYEDAMSISSTGIFHTRISALVNIHRLLPAQVVEDALDLNIPMQSMEGFVRQVLGWREYVHHVHNATDGLRRLAGNSVECATLPGDGGYERWAGRQWSRSIGLEELDGGACPNFFSEDFPLPVAWWGVESGLKCLDTVVRSVWEEGYSHHITRLMILSNIANLLGVSPRELTDWFWMAYADAYDWVVEPNVLGMGTYAIGGIMTTKPYICGAAYIDRMSDYCRECAFHPKSNCPVTNLYWAFVDRHRDTLRSNPRLGTITMGLGRRGADKLARDQAVLMFVRELLSNGEPVTPDTLPEPG